MRCRRYTYINLHALGVPNVLCAWIRPHVRLLLHAKPCAPVPLSVLYCQLAKEEVLSVLMAC
jgi:hypothetical protein